MKRLDAYFKKRFKNLEDNLERYHHLQDPEVLHQIRIEIKRIKTLLKLINFSDDEFSTREHFIPFRIIFRKAAKIRNPEVIYKLLFGYHIVGIPDELIPNLKKVDILSRDFQKEVPRFDEVVKDQKRRLSKYLKRVSKRDLRQYLMSKKEKLKKLLFPILHLKSLHYARKVDKEIIYLSEISKHDDPGQFYTKVEAIIGKWHDKQQLLPILRKKQALADRDLLRLSCKEDVEKLRTLAIQHYEQ